jgi:hypothetical protein
LKTVFLPEIAYSKFYLFERHRRKNFKTTQNKTQPARFPVSAPARDDFYSAEN